MTVNAFSTAEMGSGGEAASVKAFAQPCANARLHEIQARLEECQRIEPELLTEARIVDQKMAASDEAWNVLLPKLARQQKLRSRRGKWQNLAVQAGLETFEDWWERIFIENGFKEIPLRTVQDRLKKYRERNGQEPKPKVKRGPSLTRPQQKRLIVASILGHDLANAASRAGDDGIKASARIFLAGAPALEELKQQLKWFLGVEPAEAAEHTALAMPTRVPREVKPGDVAAIEQRIDESCGEQIDDCFEGFDGDQVANATTRVTNFFLRRYGHVARGDGAYQVSITYTPAKLQFHRKWKPKSESVN